MNYFRIQKLIKLKLIINLDNKPCIQIALEDLFGNRFVKNKDGTKIFQPFIYTIAQNFNNKENLYNF